MFKQIQSNGGQFSDTLLARTTESPEAVDAILARVIARAGDARTIIHSPVYLEHGFDSQLTDDAAQLGADLAASAPEMRRKIALVHACVEKDDQREKCSPKGYRHEWGEKSYSR